jgi:ribose transport system ATP-binding protein
MTVGKNTILSIQNLSKSFPGVKALSELSFDLREGEIHCLVGENGAGKSTLIKILSGAYSPESGELKIFGTVYRSLTPELSISLGIQTVYQESILVETLSVAENLFLGNEITNRYRAFDHRKTQEEAELLLASVGIDIDPSETVENLSTAERQIVGIAKALSRDAKILILDEPTASLSSTESNRLKKLLRDIREKGVGIIYISHHLEEVFEIADRITVIKDGKWVNTHDGKQIMQPDLICEMVGRAADLFYCREPVSAKGPKRTLEIRNYSRPPKVLPISCEIQSGEIFGIGGMVGAGRTEFVRLLFGLDGRASGNLILDGKDISPDSPLEAIRNGICLITEDRQKTGLVLVRPIKENISIARHNIESVPFINLSEEEKTAASMVKRLKIATPGIYQETKTLSGGNQQKVVLSKWLLTEADVFIFDEPTRGIDIGAKEEIYKLMTDLARNNKFIIMVSSDMPELTSMSDRIAVMRGGRFVTILSREEASEENVLSHSIGA